MASPVSSTHLRLLLEHIALAHGRLEAARTVERVRLAPLAEHRWQLNALVFEATRRLFDARQNAKRALWNELRLSEFFELPPSQVPSEVVDGVVEWFSVEVNAHGCGRWKEDCLKRLKRLPLNETQVTRLKREALSQIARPNTGLRDFARLMIRLADREWLRELELWCGHHDTNLAAKACWMRRVVENGRRDLR